jgi:hypothetical protein
MSLRPSDSMINMAPRQAPYPTLHPPTITLPSLLPSLNLSPSISTIFMEPIHTLHPTPNPPITSSPSIHPSMSLSPRESTISVASSHSPSNRQLRNLSLSIVPCTSGSRHRRGVISSARKTGSNFRGRKDAYIPRFLPCSGPNIQTADSNIFRDLYFQHQ